MAVFHSNFIYGLETEISSKFYVPQNVILIFFFWQPFKNVRTILSYKAITRQQNDFVLLAVIFGFLPSKVGLKVFFSLLHILYMCVCTCMNV